MWSEPASDPETIRTKEELGSALNRLRMRLGFSQGHVAEAAGVAKSTVSEWFSGKRIPRPYHLVSYLRQFDVPEEPWLAARTRVETAHAARRYGSGTAAVHRSRLVSVGLGPWADLYDTAQNAEEILKGNLTAPHPPTAAEPGGSLLTFASIISDLAGRHTPEMKVEAVTCYHGLTVRVESTEEFWALVSADSVLRATTDSSRQWLINRTEKAIDAQDEAQLVRLRAVWRSVFYLLRRVRRLEHGDWPPHRLVKDVNRKLKGNFLRVRRVMLWILDVFADDTVASDALRQALDRYAAAKFPDWRKAGLGRFDPNLVPAYGRLLCGYPIQSMCLPVTVNDTAVFWPDRATPGNSVLDNLPYVLGGQHDEHGEALVTFLHELVERCRDTTLFGDGEGWTWAVPTAPEWLELSGCTTDDHPYPWGTQAPTPGHANLRYPGEPLELQPPGVHRTGRSPSGALDCCGNVHEIVIWRSGALTREARGELTLADLRLAGGSFRTRAEHASCRKFRPFQPAPGTSRRNIGIRLIRYRAEDTEQRRTALQHFHRNRLHDRKHMTAHGHSGPPHRDAPPPAGRTSRP
ncbi:helix-turn-helix domain-containing protein [Streptomyces tendae]